MKKLKEFKPLILVLLFIILLTAFLMSFFQLSGIMEAMRLFMGCFFLVFGSFKLLDLKGFVMNYREYDVLAKYSSSYAFAYPFIELMLGALYLLNYAPYKQISLPLPSCL